jgi:flagellar motor switch protein FliM
VSEVLSNDQIAALIEAARSGDVSATANDQPARRRMRRVRDVDFTRPTKFTQEQQRRLRRGHESFARTASTQISAELRTPVELEVLNVDQQTWSAALSEIPQPSLYGVTELSNGLRMIVSMEQSAATYMFERLLGGTTGGAKIERELTEIELALARRVFDSVVTQLSRSWEDLMSMSLRLVAVETQQANIQLSSSSEPTLAITIEVQIEKLSSTITVLVPHRSIEAGLEQLSSGQYGESTDPEEEAKAEELVSAALRGVSVEVRAEIGSRDLTIDEVLALQPGDVLKLGPSTSGGTLYADAIPIHRTKPGLSGNRRAVEILERIDLQ